MGQETMGNLAVTSAMLKGSANSIKDVFKKLSNLVDKLDKNEDNEKVKAKNIQNSKDKSDNTSDKITASGFDALQQQREDHFGKTFGQKKEHHALKMAWNIQQTFAQRKQFKTQAGFLKTEKDMQGGMLHMSHQNWVATTSITKELIRIHSVLIGDTNKQKGERLQRMSDERSLLLGRESELDAIFAIEQKKLKLKYTNITDFNIAVATEKKKPEGKENKEILALAKVMNTARVTTGKAVRNVLRLKPYYSSLNKSKMELPGGTLTQGILSGLAPGTSDSEGSGLYQQQRAPKGGIDVGGKFFKGGQLLPHSENKPFEGKAFEGKDGCCGGIDGIFSLLKKWNSRDLKGTKNDKRTGREAKLDSMGSTYKGNVVGNKKLGGGVFKNLAGNKFSSVAKTIAGNPITSAAVGIGAWETMRAVVKKMSKLIAKYTFTPVAKWLLLRLPFLAPVFAMGPIGWVVGIASFAYAATMILDALDAVDKELSGRNLDRSGKRNNEDYLKELRMKYGSVETPVATANPTPPWVTSNSIDDDLSVESMETIKELDAKEMNKAMSMFTHKGSAYVHDIHAESWLSKIFGVLVGTAHAAGRGRDLSLWGNGKMTEAEIKTMEAKLKSNHSIGQGNAWQNKERGTAMKAARKIEVEKFLKQKEATKLQTKLQKLQDIKDGQSKAKPVKGQFNIFKGIDKFMGPQILVPEFLLKLLNPKDIIPTDASFNLLDLIIPKAHADFAAGESGSNWYGGEGKRIRKNRGTPKELFEEAMVRESASGKGKIPTVGAYGIIPNNDAWKNYSDSWGQGYLNDKNNTKDKLKENKKKIKMLDSILGPNGTIKNEWLDFMIKRGIFPKGTQPGKELYHDIKFKNHISQLTGNNSNPFASSGGQPVIINNNTTNSNSNATAVVLQSTAHSPSLPAGVGSSVHFA